MCEALDDHEGSVSIGGRLITSFRFADGIVVNADEVEADSRYYHHKMETGPDKIKVMTNNPNIFQKRSR